MMPIGWSLGGRTVAEMLALYPRSQAVRVFYEPGKGLPAAWSDPRSPLAQLPPGATVVVSHKDLGVDSLAFVEAWLAHRPDVDLELIAHHEPEQGKGGDPTRAEFRASWTRQRQQVGDHPARAEGRLRLAVCYTLQWIRAGGDWRLWWPEHEADAVDRVLFDSYQFEPGAPNPYRPRSYEDPESALAPMLEIAKATGKAWGIAEIDHLRITKENGFAVDLDPSGELCADWYRRMHAAARAAGCRLWCHYHARHGDLTERLPEQRALRDLISQEAIVTTAPANLLAVRTLLLAELGPHGLTSAEVGIVGDPAHRGGYHCGRDRVVSSDYSVVESSRDRAGLSGYASALDVGEFSVRSGGTTHNLRTFSTWLVRQCAADAADARDIREVIYSPDGRTVRRWDRLGKRSSGDGSHVYHTHFSFFRDATKAGRDLTPLFRRYLAEIGLTTSEGIGQMFCKHGDRGENVRALQYALHNIGFPPGTIDGTYGDATAAALKKAEASIGVNSDGKTYDADSYTRIQALFVKRFAAGAQGPQGEPGPRGPAGPQGPQGEPGPAGGLTMDQVADELAARITTARQG